MPYDSGEKTRYNSAEPGTSQKVIQTSQLRWKNIQPVRFVNDNRNYTMEAPKKKWFRDAESPQLLKTQRFAFWVMENFYFGDPPKLSTPRAKKKRVLYGSACHSGILLIESENRIQQKALRFISKPRIISSTALCPTLLRIEASFDADNESFLLKSQE
ncbi:hypothetical protein GYMLUDRAFT_63090 [Collybiopsis luxurians FD-317 M1]|uniref:Uncharacterized protein n=1 Tax=Collybiopsis luxurians FD-317 M1 TaxID=944289 RepID=A0A0D0AVF4_9AGAR|nr:hypothetical protein GYMLUDRAFT_63090 [Collybiopsis luxurians FD-317 M1]